MSTQVFIPVFRSLPLAIYITVKHTCKGQQSGERQLFFWLPVYKHNIIKQIDANMVLIDADVNVIMSSLHPQCTFVPYFHPPPPPLTPTQVFLISLYIYISVWSGSKNGCVHFLTEKSGLVSA